MSWSDLEPSQLNILRLILLLDRMKNVSSQPLLLAVNLFIASIFLVSCSGPTSKEDGGEKGLTPATDLKALFEQVSSETSHITFENTIVEDERYNFLSYEYYSSGGGVAVGDINNDGLSDLYFISNRGANKLYLNEGDLQFKDITDQAQVASPGGWSSGVAMVDINNDGWLDIYISRGGNEPLPEDRQNQLFINNGDLSFSEEAAAYGLNDMGRGTQAAFIDYDLDGDLDVYLLNHSNEFRIDNTMTMRYHKNPPPFVSDRFFRNDGNKTFTDVTAEAGILNFGFGLGIGVGDLNKDGWPDIFVTNDYIQNDFYYINNGQGGFVNISKVGFGHTSLFAMGCDIADVNNDGFLDIYEVEMLPEDYFRSKVNMKAMDIEGYNQMLEVGFNHQFMHNSLHMNVGPGYFSEIAQLGGVAKTDWSWAALLTDADNDGLKDIFVTNGVLHDYKNRDFVYKANEISAKKVNQALSMEEIHDLVTVTPLPNYAFRNKNGYEFEDTSAKWGFDYTGFSSGLATGDLDNDGDLDFVVGNMNSPSLIFKNTASEQGQGWVKLQFKGPASNPFGIGAKVTCTTADNEQYQELYTVRGFQSSCEPSMIFGLGAQKRATRIKVVWPNGLEEIFDNVEAEKTISVDYRNAIRSTSPIPPKTYLFQEIGAALGVDFIHSEIVYDDFRDEILLPHKLSQEGPCLAVGDIDGDGWDDFYVGGAAGQSGGLFKQIANGQFIRANDEVWQKDMAHEDTGAQFFDANGDGMMDLYVVSGSNEEQPGSAFYSDRLYLNDGKGNFQKSNSILPDMNFSGSCVIAEDIDKDGDVDLFVGGRVIPGKFPYPAESVLLLNEGNRFVKAPKNTFPALEELGMVTTATWLDFDGDQDADLLVAGEWMALRLFRNDNGVFTEVGTEVGLDNTEGWWQSLKAADFDGDGDVDFFAGNMGRNHKLTPKTDRPIHLYANDFDKNQTTDIVLAKSDKGVLKPVRGKDCASEQMPFISEKFPTFTEFANADMEGIFGTTLNEGLHFQAVTFASFYFENKGGKFERTELPIEAQVSSINGFAVYDYNRDGKKDVFMAGNFTQTEVETTRLDSGKGLCLMAGDQGWTVLQPHQTGIMASGNVKDVCLIELGEEKRPMILLGNNNAAVSSFLLNR